MTNKKPGVGELKRFMEYWKETETNKGHWTTRDAAAYNQLLSILDRFEATQKINGELVEIAKNHKQLCKDSIRYYMSKPNTDDLTAKINRLNGWSRKVDRALALARKEATNGL